MFFPSVFQIFVNSHVSVMNLIFNSFYVCVCLHIYPQRENNVNNNNRKKFHT